MKTAADKMLVPPGARAYVRGAPISRLTEMGHHDLDVHESLRGSFDYLHLFVTRAAVLDRELPLMRGHLRSAGALWISWPKGRKLDADLSLPQVINIGYRNGLVESTTIRVDEVWSAIKFTWPKPGKKYHNSFGQLPKSDETG